MGKKLLFLGIIIINLCTGCRSQNTPPEVLIPSVANQEHTPESTQTLTPQPTSTPELYSLSIHTFFDYNGNVEQEEDEPNLSGINNILSNRNCMTDENGNCQIESLLIGDYKLSIEAPDNCRYITPSISEDVKISDGLNISIQVNTELLLPLVEGPYRSPFRDLEDLYISQWVDLDTQSCLGDIPDRTCQFRLDWLGGQNIYDGHQGFDVELYDDSVVVYAMREGVVTWARFLSENDGWEVNINDIQPYSDNGDSYQMLVHMDEIFVEVGDRVNATTILGKGGHGLNSCVHIGIYT